MNALRILVPCLHASAYGTGWVKTPAFDRVAREGILFNNAYTLGAARLPAAQASVPSPFARRGYYITFRRMPTYRRAQCH